MFKFISNIVLLLIIAFSGFFIYQTVVPGCQTGIEYSLGSIPDEFNLNRETAISVAQQAAEVWNKEIGKTIIDYDPESPFMIEFIFDDRQQQTIQRLSSESNLDTSRETLENKFDSVEELEQNYRQAQKSYVAKRDRYQQNQSNYNQAVENYNAGEGGSVSDLEARSDKLANDFAQLESDRKNLNSLAKRLNRLASETNNQVEEFNDEVAIFNQQFARRGDTFKQGIYNQYGIEIYQYETESDLLALLVHEFGHALGMGHVSDEGAIMYYLQHDDQASRVDVTASDLVELERVCNQTLVESLSINQLREWLSNQT